MATRASFLLLRILRVLPFFALAAAICLPGSTANAQQARPASAHPEKLHDVISRARLAPLLRADTPVRFSPDGNYIAVQEPSGVLLLSREPLRVVSFVEVQYFYGAIFSADSKFLRIVTLDLRLGSWSIADGKLASNRELPMQQGCRSGSFSQAQELFACYRPDATVDIYRLSDGACLYSDSAARPSPIRGDTMLPLDRRDPFAGPMGFLLSAQAAMNNNSTTRSPVLFSPDGGDFIAPHFPAGYRHNFSSGKNADLREEISKRIYDALVRVDVDQVLLIDSEKPDVLEIRSLRDGKIVNSIPGHLLSARLAADSRYVLLKNGDHPGERIFDLSENRLLEIPANLGADISGSLMALAEENGDLSLYHVGEMQPYARKQLPLAGLPPLQTAALDPDLHTLALSAADKGRVFSVTDGGQVASLPRSRGAAVDASSVVFLDVWRGLKKAVQISKMDFPTQKVSKVSSVEDSLFRVSRGTTLAYSPDTMGVLASTSREGRIPYHMRVFDTFSGVELWKRNFSSDSPIAFPDPQGDRIVLGWFAKDSGAAKAAGQNQKLKETFKSAKTKPQDSFFEVLEARSGKSLGGALVAVGLGPWTYDFAFSVGESLIVGKDGMRVSVYSIKDGSLVARLTGNTPAANGAAKLLALKASEGKMILYDLDSGTKLDEQMFPDEIVYQHFSDDGKNLLVLTAHQWVFVLDVSKIPRTEALPKN